MRSGFKFKGRASSDMGVTVRTRSRPILPAVKRFTMDLSCRDGEYDFSAVNPQQRVHYSPRIFSVSIFVSADSLGALQKKISDISLWLAGSGELIFDDIPLIKWDANVSDEIIYMPERGGKNAALEVTFRAHPMGKCIFGEEGPLLDAPLEIGESVPLSMEEMYVYTVNQSAEITVINFGDRPARPVIEIEGSARSMTLSLDGRELSFTANGDVTVDFEKRLVGNTDGVLKVSGEFFEFKEGANTLQITNSVSSALTVTMHLTPEYMYGAHFEGFDGGDGDA